MFDVVGVSIAILPLYAMTIAYWLVYFFMSEKHFYKKEFFRVTKYLSICSVVGFLTLTFPEIIWFLNGMSCNY